MRRCKDCYFLVVCQANFGKTKKDICNSGAYKRKWWKFWRSK